MIKITRNIFKIAPKLAHIEMKCVQMWNLSCMHASSSYEYFSANEEVWRNFYTEKMRDSYILKPTILDTTKTWHGIML